MTRDSHSSDRGRLVGGATHRLEVRPMLAVKIASKQSQKYRLGVGGGLFSEKQPDGAAPWCTMQKTEGDALKPGMILSLCKRMLPWLQSHP